MVGFGYYRYPFRWRTSPGADNQEVPVGCFLMVIVPVLFVVSAYFAWWELRYFIQGSTVDATVDDVREITKGRRYAEAKYFAVRYSFEDESIGRGRTERDDVPISWSRPAQTVRVQYIAQLPGISRLAGHRNDLSVILFVACLAALLVSGVLLLRDARRAVREEQAFESKRRREGL